MKQDRVVGCMHVSDDVLHYSVEAQSCSSLLCCCDDVDRPRDAYSGTHGDGDVDREMREMMLAVAPQ